MKRAIIVVFEDGIGSLEDDNQFHILQEDGVIVESREVMIDRLPDGSLSVVEQEWPAH